MNDVLAFDSDGGAIAATEKYSESVTKLLSDGEVILAVMRPSIWYVVLWPLGSLLVIMGMVFALAWATRFSWVGWTDSQVFGLGLVLLAIRLTWQFLEWANRLYILTDRRVLRRKGVFQVDVFEARLDRIQQTSVLQLVRERIFGLGSLAFATAGTSTLDAIWEAIADPFEAQRMVTEAINRYGRGSGGL